ncbi:unnamed protein product [Rhizoctonia solani]|uniref:Berberine/berberine-like domain-containing protein n=1 Tax=Rhizoctonia solani TaxID=456999 RepID=A0A8H3CYF0_9AGAM|nr:unnamed protein product [Rhizoctonia solani]
MRGRTFEAAYLFISVISPGVLGAQHSTADQLCWPSSKVWAALSSSIDGQLVAPRPPGWAYHDPKYDEAACNDFQANWNNSFWRANQYGAMQNPIWDSLECNIGTPRNVTCDQGFVPHCSVNAHNDNHAAEAVKFADRYNLSLVIKNTGHDYLGRSSREGSFSIWTHHLKGIIFKDSFVANGCPQNETGVSVITIPNTSKRPSGVYKVADAHNVSVVGGGAPSVGAAGGWIQGGGHSPLGGLFGMGVDMPTTASIHPSFYDMFNAYIQDPSIGTPIWFGTRLVSRNALVAKSSELVKYIWGDGQRLSATFSIVGGREIRCPANASAGEIEQVGGDITQLVQQFGRLTGLDDAAYYNEAGPLELQWKKAFFGSHYDRLLRIKQQIDPKGLFTCNRCIGSDQ